MVHDRQYARRRFAGELATLHTRATSIKSPSTSLQRRADRLLQFVTTSPPRRAPCRAPRPPPAGSTAAFVALVANAAANNAYNATSGDANASAIIRTLMKPLPRTRRPLPPAVPAESSLWGAPAQQQAAEAAPYNANLASMPIISGAADIDLDDLDEPAAITASIDAPRSHRHRRPSGRLARGRCPHGRLLGPRGHVGRRHRDSG